MNIANLYHGALSGFVFILLFTSLFLAGSAQHVIKFRYMAPTDVIEKNFKNWIEDKDAHHSGLSTAKINEWTEDVFEKVAPENLYRLYSEMQVPEFAEKRLKEYFEISGGKVFSVTFYLINDNNDIYADKYSAFHLAPIAFSNGEPYQFYVLPRAYNVPFNDGSGEYAAFIYLGSTYMAKYQESKGELPLDFAQRYLAYTQFVEKDTADEWASLSRFAVYSDERNQDLVYKEELWEEPEKALISGFSSFFEHMGQDWSRNSSQEIFYSNPDTRYVISPSSSLAQIPGMDVDEQRVKTKINEISEPVYGYSFSYLPSEAFLHSETLSSMLFTHWYRSIPIYTTSSYRYINNGKKWIQELAHNWWDDHKNRNLHYAVMFLAQKMEVYAKTRRGSNQVKDGSWISSMYPFALFDYLTRFSFSEDYLEKVYDHYYTDEGPQAFRMYMDFYRKEVKELALPFYKKRDKDGDYLFTDGLEALTKYFQQTHTIIK